MNLVFFSHPDFLGHESMPRFSRMLAEGMEKRGHRVEVWTAKPRFYKIPAPATVKKWLGYIDQFIVFPQETKRKLRSRPQDTLFIFTDHTLGPWVPLVSNRPNVVHSHDFMAQLSALGEIKENTTGWTGRHYQTYIRWGYSKARHFIAVSEKTKQEACRFVPKSANVDLVYNGLNQSFPKLDPVESRRLLSKKTGLHLTDGYLLHVGGNAWYKNRTGVLQIYDQWRSTTELKIPLLMIGQKPSAEILHQYQQSRFKSDIYFVGNVSDEYVRIAYAGASVFLFPSLAEGFGWPIAEAMASGCPVITTGEVPMTEVAGTAGFLIQRYTQQNKNQWAKEASEVLEKVLALSAEERQETIEAGLKNVQRFDTGDALNRIEAIYKKVVQNSVYA